MSNQIRHPWNTEEEATEAAIDVACRTPGSRYVIYRSTSDGHYGFCGASYWNRRDGKGSIGRTYVGDVGGGDYRE